MEEHRVGIKIKALKFSVDVQFVLIRCLNWHSLCGRWALLKV
jgi:hypothetical protein